MLSRLNSYEALRREFRWNVPRFYNLAADMCDRWADGSGRLALIHQRRDGRIDRYSFDEVQRSLPGPDAAAEAQAALTSGRPGQTPLDELRQKLRPAPQDRLARMVDLNEERTAQILRKWAHREEAA